MNVRWISESRPYFGPELRPHFLLTEFGMRGSALGAWRGPCLVQTEHLVDWEDRLERDRIEAKEMIHFIGEFFGASLREGVLRQRLLVSSVAQILADEFEVRQISSRVLRSGDDLMIDGRKLSVSIVTASPVSQLLHLGLNIDPCGAPVAAVGIAEWGIEPQVFAEKVLKAFAEEWDSIEWAIAKVRPVT